MTEFGETRGPAVPGGLGQNPYLLRGKDTGTEDAGEEPGFALGREAGNPTVTWDKSTGPPEFQFP